ncbi:MAG: hypothetical protein ACJ789_14165 [Thermomicrobiales bacterium]
MSKGLANVVRQRRGELGLTPEEPAAQAARSDQGSQGANMTDQIKLMYTIG